MDAVTGTAAGVPFTALPPRTSDVSRQDHAPLIITWHMLDAPRTDAAFAAALPMAEVPAWRVHLGMPMCGARMPAGGVDEVFALARDDAVSSFLVPFVESAVAEFPAALAAVRAQLPVDDGPVTIVGASLGGAVALQVLADAEIPVHAAVLINPAIRVSSAVPLVEPMAGHRYEWSEQARQRCADLDFVARAREIAPPPLLIVSGDDDHPEFRADAADLVAALRGQDGDPGRIEQIGVPGLAHPLADEPGMEPAPQRADAHAVDEIVTRWLRRVLPVAG